MPWVWTDYPVYPRLLKRRKPRLKKVKYQPIIMPFPTRKELKKTYRTAKQTYSAAKTGYGLAKKGVSQAVAKYQQRKPWMPMARPKHIYKEKGFFAKLFGR